MIVCVTIVLSDESAEEGRGCPWDVGVQERSDPGMRLEAATGI